tara:strand:+ start:1148 stop:2272 length:1125 start_codon:yes stop_codon:yes gene_type:complete
MKKTRDIIILGPNSFSFLNFRYDFLIELKRKYNVIIVGNIENIHTKKFKKLGIKFFNTKMNNSKIEIIKDIFIFFKILKLVIQTKPKFIVSYTIKSNLISGILSYFFCKKIYFFSFLTGLGNIYLACKNSFIKKKIFFLFYKIIFKKNNLVFFQNKDDLKLFKKNKITKNNSKLNFITGVNVSKIKPQKHPKGVNFLMISRIIKNKGVYEYLMAANSLKKKYKKVNFYFAGKFDNSNYSLSKKKFYRLIKENIYYLGWKTNIVDAIKKCNVVVLPSYREGLPRSILEGMAMEKAVLVSNVPGCRETIQKNYNGFFIKDKNHKSLISGMKKFIINKKIISVFGKRSRILVIRKFDSKKIAKEIVKNIEKCVEYQA